MKTAKNNNLSKPVYEYLRDMILRLEIKSGEKIPESKIAEKFGISRTPIREALRRLANEGLVNIYPNRFAEVITFDDKLIENMGTIRLSLDIMAVKLAIYYGSNADFERVRCIATQCLEASKKKDIFEQNRYDVQFHMSISNISKNSILEKYQSQLFLQLELLLNWMYNETGESSSKTHSHFDIVDAMLARDQATAVRLVTEHMLGFYKLNPSLVKLLYEQ